MSVCVCVCECVCVCVRCVAYVPRVCVCVSFSHVCVVTNDTCNVQPDQDYTCSVASRSKQL